MMKPFTRLSWSLLVISLTLAPTSASAPTNRNPEHDALTPENFRATTAEGIWLVEHFSPYCYHCREFAPTWQRLVDDTENTADPGIKLAQVNCAVNGDLCDEHFVQGYPQLNIYKDGEFIEYYKGPREYDHLKEYISKHAQPRLTPESVSPSPFVADVPIITWPVETQHTQASGVVFNPSGNVMVLDQNNFGNVVDQGPVFVKFFAPWCGHCKKLAPTWTQLAKHMQHRLNIAEVNCDDNTQLCISQGVLGYPMLQFYLGGIKTEYMGGRKLDQLKAFAEKATAPGVQELVTDELKSHVEKHSVLYLLLHSSSEDHILNEVKKSSQILLGSPPIFSSTSVTLFNRFTVPTTSPWVLLALKNHDDVNIASVFYGPSSPSAPNTLNESLTSWLLQNRLPTSLELTRDSFQSVMNARHRPLVVIATVNKGTKERVGERMKEIGKVWNVRKANRRTDYGGDRDVVFAWMDADKWAKWLKSMYGIEAGSAEGPVIVVADHAQLLYYDRDQTGQPVTLTSTSIFSVVDGVLGGTLSAKNSENIVERMARYLNNKLTSVEHYVRNHTMQAVCFIGLALVLAFLVFKRLVMDDRPLEHDVRKSNRLD